MKPLYSRVLRTFIIITSVAVFSALMDYPHLVSGTAREYDLDNPMYDVFYLYYDDQRSDALSILNRAMKKKKYRESALINRGIIEYYEGRYARALDWYNKALSHGFTGASYILDHASGKDQALFEKTLAHLASASNLKATFWIDYERASRYARKGDSATALALLEEACKNGFNHPGLILNDPAWKRTISHPDFKKIEKKYLSSGITEDTNNSVLEISLKLARGTPMDLSPELTVAYQMLSHGKNSSAIPYLNRVIATSSNRHHVFIARYWKARVHVLQEKYTAARQEIDECRDILKSLPGRESQFSSILLPLFRDIIENDPLLKKI